MSETLKNIAAFNGSACGAGDPTSSACGSACGTADPKKVSACGAADPDKK